MKTCKIIEIMGDFNLLIDKEIKGSTDEEIKKIILEEIKKNIDKYIYPVIEEIKL